MARETGVNFTCKAVPQRIGGGPSEICWCQTAMPTGCKDLDTCHACACAALLFRFTPALEFQDGLLWCLTGFLCDLLPPELGSDTADKAAAPPLGAGAGA